MRWTLFPTLLFVATSCLPDAETRAARAWVARLEPLLYENGFLAERVLFAAAAVHDGDLAPAEVREVWHTEVLPLAQHLAWQAAATTPPPEWAEVHAGLTEVWAARADAYRALDLALAEGDREGWRQAREDAKAAILAEEEWFRSADIRLQPHGLAIDQYP